MEEILEKIKYFIEIYKKRIIISGVILLLSIIFGLTFLFLNLKKSTDKIIENNVVEVIDNNSKGQNNENIEEKKEEIIKTVKVDIKGEVKNPGVYELSDDSRIIDVINMAGGVTKNGSASVNNLARKIYDGMVIIIYSKDEINNFKEIKKEEEAIIKESTNYKDTLKNDAVLNNKDIDSNTNIKGENASSNSSNTISDKIDDVVIDNEKDNKISINTATIEELTSLDGIGESKAKSIIEYRNKNGLFTSIDEIMNVSGIGQTVFDKIKDHIKL